MTNAVEVRNVSKVFRLHHERNQTFKSAIMRGRISRYEEFIAVNDVSFDVKAGTTFGLIGSNGSGKSTLLKCLAKILVPNLGTISYSGRMAAMLEVGSGFHHELTGLENIYLNGSILGMRKKEIDQKLDEIIDFSGVGSFIDQPVKNYSSGMYVRLGFSVAISVRPDILIADEVLAVGDEAFQRKCHDRFAQMRNDGRTVILVSHSMEAVQDMCDEVAWLERGVLREVGKPIDVVSTYIRSLGE